VGWTGAQLTRNAWVLSARLAQYPLLDEHPDIWLVTGGRGAGKTRLGAEWVNALVRGLPPFATPALRYGRLALVGETLADVRDVMIEGPSGIVGVSQPWRPRYEPSRRRLVWENGAVATIFSSEDPESLRGHQFDAAWCDEAGKWRNAEACFDMLQFGLRLGNQPRQLITTTPRPSRLIKRLLADPTVLVTRMRTAENAANLAAGFIEAVANRYAGSVLGRQELDGELVEDREDALWTRSMIESAISERPGELRRIVVAVDPPASSRRTSDACGIIAAGMGNDGRAVVLADATLNAARPQDWATRAVSLYHALAADCLLVEVNQGGEMASAVIRTVDASVPVKPVRAQRGKWLRAEPVAALYQADRVRHAGRFPELEDEMCDFGPHGLSGGRSPDRVDALVWALSELLLNGRDAEPRIRDFGI
jgi:phage terminase large subunit-like protein